MPVVASMTVWIWIVDWRRGLLNWLLVRLGDAEAQGHNWLSEPLSFFAVACAVVVWMSVPFVALLDLRGADPGEHRGPRGRHDRRRERLAEAAPHHRAARATRCSRSSSCSSSSGTCGCSPRSSCSRTPASVANETNLLGTFVYQLGTGKGDFGTASAVSVLMLVLTLALSWPYVRSLIKEES